MNTSKLCPVCSSITEADGKVLAARIFLPYCSGRCYEKRNFNPNEPPFSHDDTVRFFPALAMLQGKPTQSYGLDSKTLYIVISCFVENDKFFVSVAKHGRIVDAREAVTAPAEYFEIVSTKAV